MSDQLRSSQESESKPVRVLGATAAALLAIVAGLAVIPGVPGWVPAAVGVAGLGLTVWHTSYTGNQVTPWQDVAAKRTPTGRIVSGPADKDHPTGASVAVVADTTPPSFQPGGSPTPADELPENRRPEEHGVQPGNPAEGDPL